MAFRSSVKLSTRCVEQVAKRQASGLPRDVYIVSSARTPIASFNKSFANMSAVELGTIAAKGAIERAGVSVNDIEEVIMGNVISAGLGQSPARQVALNAGCPESTEALTINKVCASGMKSIALAAQSIALGQREVMLAGGMESMSNVPYILRQMRAGATYGHGKVEDILLGDGLSDAFDGSAMGMCGEDTAEKFGFTREQLDEFALESYARSAKANDAGLLAKEIVPVPVPQRRGDPKMVTEDEEFRNVKPEKVPSLRPAFKKDGVVTAANASSLNDGAGAVVVASGEAVERLELTPMAKILGMGDAARAPIEFPIAPALATPVALAHAGVDASDVARWEVNEAFAVVVLANAQLLDMPLDKVNINGGAVSLGHPIGMSGMRIVGSLAHHLESGEIGCASICNGGGAASAMIIQKC
eukprot:TRINITY_DN10353_c0_g1_i2.p1 TRINITY_DN10353_c0_g1~~TRINITY_DN10353_c0_g1_i2.p1  ORF type:complete len:450 (+),score=100.36 TRINITY_DN10353_c0_g1_i2:103-1350(+)